MPERRPWVTETQWADFTNTVYEILPNPRRLPDVGSTNMELGNYEQSKESREALFSYRIEAHQANWGTDHHINPSVQEKDEQLEKEVYLNVKRRIFKSIRWKNRGY